VKEPKVETKPRIQPVLQLDEEPGAVMERAAYCVRPDRVGWTLERLWCQGDRVVRRETLMTASIKTIVLNTVFNLLEQIE
jgi:hypothetical protein